MTFNKVTVREFLEEYLLRYDFETIIETLCATHEERAHIFEGIFRAGAAFQCLPEGYRPCTLLLGNSNVELHKMQNVKEYLEQSIKLGKGAGQSDLSFFHKDTLYLGTSKYFMKGCATKSLDDFDLNGLARLSQKYSNLASATKYIVMVRDRADFERVWRASEKKHLWKDHIAEVWDLDDLRNIYYDIYRTLRSGASVEEALRRCQELQRVPMQLRFHQEIALARCDELEKEDPVTPLLFALAPRSGKSYLMAGHILQSIRKGKKKFLIITPIPKETLQDFQNNIFEKLMEFADVDMRYIQNTISLTGTKRPVVAMMSKQIENGKEWPMIRDGKFDVIYFDESHHGGSTDMTKKMLENYMHGSGASEAQTLLVFITATFHKPHMAWKIPSERILHWDMEDIEACRQGDMQVLAHRHGNALDKVMLEKSWDIAEIRKAYAGMPRMCIFSAFHSKEFVKEFESDNPDGQSYYGMDMDRLFSLRGDGENFQHPAKIQEALTHVFGTPTRRENTVLELIDRHGRRNDASISMDFLTMLWFLPYGVGRVISKVAPLLQAEIARHPMAKKYKTLDLTGVVGDLRQAIETAEQEARNAGAKGLILLSGQRASMGISLPSVSIVFLWNTETSADAIYQKMYRCMTEQPGKKYGYVVDFHARRVLTTMLAYTDAAGKHRAEEGIREKIERLSMLLDFEDVMGYRERSEIVNAMLTLWRSSYTTRHEYILQRLMGFDYGWEEADLRPITKLIGGLSKTKASREKTSITVNTKEETLAEAGYAACSGDDKESNDDSERSEESDAEGKEQSDAEGKEQSDADDLRLYGEDFMPSVIRLIALLSCDQMGANLYDSLEYISTREELRDIFLNTCDGWWGIKRREAFLPALRTLLCKITNPNDINGIFFTIKGAMEYDFNLDDKKSLLMNLHSMLKPKEIEKKQFGEVFTPLSLVEEMLSKLPTEVWTNPNLRWFDPCVGIGNFMVCIYYRLMESLREYFPDDITRREHIIRNMLYMSELNPKNVFICRKIFGEEANLWQGDTLELRPQDVWDLREFDVIVGNPPYQPPSNGKKGGKSLWPMFVRYVLEHLKEDGYLCFVHPALWRKPGNELHDLMFSQQFLYLSIHTKQEGDRVFHATTRYDWYVIRKRTNEGRTTVRMDDGTICEMKIMPEISYIPNRGISILEKTVKIARRVGHLETETNNECHTMRPHVSKESKAGYVYPILNSVSKTRGRNIVWSSKIHSLQTRSKVLFSNGETIEPFYDPGEYGITQGGIYILVDTAEEGEKIVRFLRSKLVRYIIAATKWSNFETNKQVFWSLPHPRELRSDFTDQDIYDYFEFTEEERQRIEG